MADCSATTRSLKATPPRVGARGRRDRARRRFEDFAEAIAFVNRVAEAAEEANHHPDILVHGWNKVRLSLTNHSAGGLTEADFAMAARFDGLG